MTDNEKNEESVRGLRTEEKSLFKDHRVQVRTANDQPPLSEKEQRNSGKVDVSDASMS